MAANVGKTVVGLAAASLAVGLVLSWLGITPLDILDNLGETVRRVYEVAGDFANWSAKYVLLGAVLVVPIWAIFKLPTWLGALRRRRRGSDGGQS